MAMNKLFFPVLLVVLTIAQGACVYYRVNYWPFNSFLMFSGYRAPQTAQGYRLYGNLKNGDRIDFDIRPSKVYFLNYHARRQQPDFEMLKKYMQLETKRNLAGHTKYRIEDLSDVRLIRLIGTQLQAAPRLLYSEQPVLTLESGEL